MGTEEKALTIRKFDLHGVKKKKRKKGAVYIYDFDLGDYSTLQILLVGRVNCISEQ